MPISFRPVPALALAAALAAGAGPGIAAEFSFSGTFTDDDDVVVFDFVLGSAATVTLRSYSYAGGVQADGTVVAAGGVDPILAIFVGTGAFIASQDDANDGVPTDPDTGAAYDVLLPVDLLAGDYTVSVSQYDNFAAGSNFSDGFSQSGATFTSAFNCSNGKFCDVTGSNRTNVFAFDILNVDSAGVGDGTTGGVDTGGGGGGGGEPSVVPVPAAGWLGLLAMGALGALRRRRG